MKTNLKLSTKSKLLNNLLESKHMSKGGHKNSGNLFNNLTIFPSIAKN
jgi:hypothetical protein